MLVLKFCRPQFLDNGLAEMAKVIEVTKQGKKHLYQQKNEWSGRSTDEYGRKQIERINSIA